MTLRKLAYFDYETGNVSDVALIESERPLSDFERPGFGVREVSQEFDDTAHWIDPTTLEETRYTTEGAARRLAFRNTGGFRWVPAQEQWVDERPIEAVKTSLMESLKRKRDEILEGGFTWDGSPFDSDAEISQPRLLGLFTSAAMGLLPPEGQPWRLQDNTWRVLSASDAQQVWGAFQHFMAAAFAAFAAHEAVVLPSDDIAFLRNYDINAGWQ